MIGHDGSLPQGASRDGNPSPMQTFVDWIALPENRLARAAADRVAESVCTGRAAPGMNPLFLHGPSGIGKSYLASALAAAVIARAPDRIVVQRSAGDLVPPHNENHPDGGELAAIRGADLVIVDDLHHLPERAIETFVQVLDRGLARGQQWVVTAVEGPARLSRLPGRFTGRLTSRLASGLVVGIDPPSPASRQVIFLAFAGQRGLDVEIPAPVLDWLAEHATVSFRELQGAVARLQTLAGLFGFVPPLEAVQQEFRAESDAHRPTVERIVQRVGRYFRVDPDQLQGPSRTRGVLLPRQVGMYLVRRLTRLSLKQIGAHFGGRDHSTVLHACRKVEEALDRDVTLSGAVRQLHADLT
jgi:chromosomal replication initiator protein